jgi:hypothetical protein
MDFLTGTAVGEVFQAGPGHWTKTIQNKALGWNVLSRRRQSRDR